MTPDDLHDSLRMNLSRMLDQRGLSQRALSRYAALDETAVKQILSGRSRSPRLDTVARLSEALGTSVAALIGEGRSDSELYASLVAMLGVFRDAGLMDVDENEQASIAAALAEALSFAPEERDEGAAHVAAVARNVANLRAVSLPERG